MAAEKKRPERVAEGIRSELSALLLKGAKDPRLEGVVLTRCQVTGDLRVAKVGFRVMGAGQDDVASRERAERGLTSAAPMLRREVAQRLALRVAPELRFVFDAGIEASERIETLLDEIKRGPASS